MDARSGLKRGLRKEVGFPEKFSYSFSNEKAMEWRKAPFPAGRVGIVDRASYSSQGCTTRVVSVQCLPQTGNKQCRVTPVCTAHFLGLGQSHGFPPWAL